MRYLLHILKKNCHWLLLLVSSTATFAAIPKPFMNSPYPPRLTIEGSTISNTFGKVDLMFPVAGNFNQTYYADITGKYGDDRGWLGSVGAVYREIRNNFIVGGYFFIDYNRTANANHFTVLNPGIEWMNNQWDAHFNVYIPVGDRSELIDTFTGTQLNMPSATFFINHTQYDTLFGLFESVGPGADMEVGLTFNALPYLFRARAFVDGYHFDPKNTASITGGGLGLESTTKYRGLSVEVRDTYDNVNHNTFLVTLKYTFGGINKSGEPEIHDRMLDPIPRHVGSLDQGDGIPSQKKLITTGSVVVRDNIWFFNPDPADVFVFDPALNYQSCTFENPCVGLSESSIDTISAIAPNANFYLSPGLYNNPLEGSGFDFHNGQNIFGRTSNFKQAAVGNNRPVLNDSLFLEGNNNVYDLRVIGRTIRNLETGGGMMPFQVGAVVRSFAAGPVSIFNTDITSNSFTTDVVGIANNSDFFALNVYNVVVNTSATNVPGGGISVGGGNLRTGTFNVFDSFFGTVNTNNANVGSLALSFVNNETGTVNIFNSTFSTNIIHGGFAAGILNNSTLAGQGTISMIGANVVVNGHDTTNVVGILNQSNNLAGISGNVNVIATNVSVTSTNSVGGVTFGAITGGTGTMNINNSIIRASGNSGDIIGLGVGLTPATMNISNSVISVNNAGASVGTLLQNEGIFNNRGNNFCLRNGSLVLCPVA